MKKQRVHPKRQAPLLVLVALIGGIVSGCGASWESADAKLYAEEYRVAARALVKDSMAESKRPYTVEDDFLDIHKYVVLQVVVGTAATVTSVKGGGHIEKIEEIHEKWTISFAYSPKLDAKGDKYRGLRIDNVTASGGRFESRGPASPFPSGWANFSYLPF